MSPLNLLILFVINCLLLWSLWGIGSFLVPRGRPALRLCAGWGSLFLSISLIWALHLTARQGAPLLWLLLAAGLVGCFWKREARAALLLMACALPLALLLWGAFLRSQDLLVFSSFGMDVWGYLNAADWLQTHALTQAPIPGVDAMRYNWTAYILGTQERPLIYETLACLSAALRQPAHAIYLLLPLSLLSSCAGCIALHPRGRSRIALTALLLGAGLLAALHPLPLLNWVAQLFANHVCACLVGLALAALLSGTGDNNSEDQRLPATAWALLLLVCCGGLYARQLLPFAWACAGLPLLSFWVMPKLIRQAPASPNWTLKEGWPLAAAALLSAVTLANTLPVGSELIETGKIGDRLGQLLSVFGGVSPFGWYGYYGMPRSAYQPGPNPLGLLCAVLALTLLGWLLWRRWQNRRDLSLALVVLLVLAALARVANDHNQLARALGLLIPGLLLSLLVAALDAEDRPAWLLAGLLALLPPLRSAGEIQTHLQGEVLAWHQNDPAPADGQTIWPMLAYLHFNEDARGYDWPAHPVHFLSCTHFLPAETQARLQALHGMQHLDTKQTPAHEVARD